MWSRPTKFTCNLTVAMYRKQWIFEIFPLNVSADHLKPNWGRGDSQGICPKPQQPKISWHREKENLRQSLRHIGQWIWCLATVPSTNGLTEKKTKTKMTKKNNGHSKKNHCWLLNSFDFLFLFSHSSLHRFATTNINSRVANIRDEATEITFTVELPKAAFISNFSM